MTNNKWFGRIFIIFRYCKALGGKGEYKQNESVADYLLGCNGAAAKERHKNESS